jgi:hypothetical protein
LLKSVKYAEKGFIALCPEFTLITVKLTNKQWHYDNTYKNFTYNGFTFNITKWTLHIGFY